MLYFPKGFAKYNLDIIIKLNLEKIETKTEISQNLCYAVKKNS